MWANIAVVQVYDWCCLNYSKHWSIDGNNTIQRGSFKVASSDQKAISVEFLVIRFYSLLSTNFDNKFWYFLVGAECRQRLS